MIIQISGLNICERLHQFIAAAINLMCGFVDKRAANENHIIIFNGNIFATRTYLPVEDINFFKKILKQLEKYKVIFTMGHSDFYADGKNVKVSYEMYLRDEKIPFINKEGVHDVHGIKISYVINNASIIDPNSYAVFYQACPDSLPECLGGMCNTHVRFIKGNVASAGPLVQVNPEDGHQFGFIFWRKAQPPTFMPMHLPIPQLNLAFKNNIHLELPDAKAMRVLARFLQCDDQFMSNTCEIIRDKYKCPLEVAEDKIFENISHENPHDMNIHINTIKRLYGSDPLHEKMISDYMGLVKISTCKIPQWSIEYLTWDNMFSYSTGSFIDFRKIRGATFIVGRNKSGKSSIIDILMLILFDKTVRVKKIEDVINKNGDKRAYVKCCLKINDKQYIIERFFDARGKNLVQKFKLSAAAQDISGRNLKDTYMIFHSIFPLTYEKFKLNIAIQEEKSLITMSSHNKCNLAAYLLGMDYMIAAQEEAAERKKQCTDQYKMIKNMSKKNNPESKMIELESEIFNLEQKVREDAGVFAAFPNNLHNKSLFLAALNSYVGAIKTRQQFILSGMKPVGSAIDTSTMQQDIAKYKLLSCAVGMNGVMGQFFSQFMKSAEQVTNKILDKISDFRIKIETLKTGFEVFILHDMKEIPAASASGYQKFLIDLVMRLVLVSRSRITNIKLIIIDEGFGCLDDTNFIKVAKAIEILKNFASIVIITHLDELQSYGDNFIHVDRNIVQFGNLTNDELSQSHEFHEDKKK